MHRRLYLFYFFIIIVLASCSPESDHKPSDFSLVLSWNTGALPPEYTYSYEITIGPDLMGTLKYQFGYNSTESSHQYSEAFQITQDQIESLYHNLKDQDIFRNNWIQGETTEGGPGSSLTLSAKGKEYHLPCLSTLTGKDYNRMETVIETIRDVVPIELWHEMQSRQQIYESEYEY